MSSNRNILNKSMIYLCLTIVFSTLQAQTFEINYSTANDDYVYQALLISDQEVIFAVNSGTFDLNYSTYNSKLIKMNHSNGEYIDSVTVQLENPIYTNTGITDLFLIGDSLILIIGSCYNKISFEYSFYIQHYSSGFDLLFDTIIENYEINPLEYKIHENSILYLTGRYQPYHQFIEERDLWGNLLRKVDFYFDAYVATSIHRTSEYYHMFLGFDNDSRFVIVNLSDLTVDTILQYPQGFSPRNTIGSIDSNYYFVAGRMNYIIFPIPPGFHRNLAYLKVNNSGLSIELLDYHTDSLNYFSIHSFSLANGFMFLGGTQMLTWPSIPEFFMFPGPRWLLLYKLTHDGDVVWQKFYKGEVDYMMYKVLATPDGGALIFSTRYDWNDPTPNQRDVHILKVDSDGNYVMGIKEVKIETRQILVYPNPATDVISFAFGLYNNLEISIFDSQGKLLHSNTYKQSSNIDISDFKPGIYFYAIHGHNGFAESGKFIKQ